MTLTKRLGWTAWALVPVVALWFHYGAGQRLMGEERAARLLRDAARLETLADEAQGAAYETQLASIEARRALRSDEGPETEAASKAAGEEEDRAYAAAATAWQAVADKLGEAQSVLAAGDSTREVGVRVARGRALIRAGKIAQGVNDLASMLGDLDESGNDAALAKSIREEMATGYYYGARILRMNGRPDEEWRAVSGVARRNFRYLAEHAHATRAPDASDLQKNLELVLDLEQTPSEDLIAMALPRNSPGGACDAEGLLPKQGKKNGKRPKPGPDARGAGGVEAIPPGW